MELSSGSELKAVEDGIWHGAPLNVGPQNSRRTASLQNCSVDAGKSSCNIYFLSHSVAMGRGDGQEPGDVRPTSSIQAPSQQLLTWSKGQGNRWAGGKREKYLALSVKSEAAFTAVGVDGGQRAERFWYQQPNKAEWDTPGATALSHSTGFAHALAQAALSPRIHAGNVGERFSESRNDPAPSPASLCAVLCLDSACGESQLGTSHSTCRKLELSVEVVVLWGQELWWDQQGEKPLGRITLIFWSAEELLQFLGASPAESTPKDRSCGSSSGAAIFGRGVIFGGGLSPSSHRTLRCPLHQFYQ